MDGRERVIRTLRFEKPDRAPRHLWYWPGIEMFRKDELDAVQARYPDDICLVDVPYGKSKREKGIPNVVGTYIDPWGCEWIAGESGVIGEVKNPQITDWSKLDNYSPPYELLDNVDLNVVNSFCAETDKFVLAFVGNPFERMQFLRGTEAIFLDLGYGADEIVLLRDMVHQFNMQHLEMLCQTDIDGITFSDDWGAQQNMLISPKMWRELFKPLYADYCRVAHEAGKFAFMHSDGQISSIYPDLIEIGLDALNSQLFCMDMEELGRLHKGKITFWGEIDRQYILPFGTPDEVREAVRKVRKILDDGTGGVFAQAEWGMDVSQENIETMFETWLE